MGKGPSGTTLQWCQKEAGPIARGLKLLIEAQLGHTGRSTLKTASRNCLKAAVMASGEIDPLNKSHSQNALPFTLPNIPMPPIGPSLFSAKESMERAGTVATGIKTFAQLLAQGTYPGSGGFTISPSGERVYGSKGLSVDALASTVQGLEKFADLLQSGKIPFPSFPTTTSSTKESAHKITHTTGATRGATVVTGDGALPPPPPKPLAETETPVVLDNGLTPEEEEFLLKAARTVDDLEAEAKLRGKQEKVENIYRPELPAEFTLDVPGGEMISDASRERSVPASRVARLATFGQLGVGLAAGAAAEVTRRMFGVRPQNDSDTVASRMTNDNPFLTPANADRIVQTLCRVRGAALKLGQMLSIQDQDTVPAPLLEIFERVRHSADFMPIKQVHRQMEDSFGASWRERFQSFDDRPFAAASIGQVHKATLQDGRQVAVKVQYPGVARGIDSDIDNLVSILSIGGLFPKGMFLDAFVTVARRELKQECDYLREARAVRAFRRLTEKSNDFYVPEVIDELSTAEVLTTEYIVGKPVDACVGETQVVRDYIAGKFIELCLREIFEWRFMQTDPNWSNFFFGKHPKTGEPRLILLDFGASRSYKKEFVDRYMQIIRGAYEGDHDKIIKYSRDIGFLTGYETDIMNKAHCESVLILGETLTSDHPYDFSQQNVTKRIHQLIPIMLEHRLTSPPEEIYSLHRKLSGSYLLAAKLNATVSCGGLFQEIYGKYQFGDDGKCIDIDSDDVAQRAERENA